MKSILFTLFWCLVLNIGVSIFTLITAEESTCIGKGQYITSWKYKSGDNQNWSSAYFDDSEWSDLNSFDNELNASRFHWLRTLVTVCDSARDGELLNFQIANLRNWYQIFWDGKLVGENGVLDSNGKIKEYGKIYFSTSIKYQNSAFSNHVLSIRFVYKSSQNENLNFGTWIGFSEIKRFYTTKNFLNQIGIITISLTAIIIGFALFLSGGIFRSYLYFVLICLPILLVFTYNFIICYFNLSTYYLTFRQFFWEVASDLSTLFILIFFIFSFHIRKKTIQIGSIGTILFLPNFGLLFGTQINIWLVIIYCYALIIYAIRKRINGSVIALVAFFGYSFPELLNILNIHLDYTYYNGSYGFFIVSLIFMISSQVQNQNRLRQSIEAHSRRLENELLKKTIQPHFIANSLSAIRSLSKTNPDRANKLVQAISSEFYLLNKIINESEITVAQEIELCQYHLEVMGYRRDATYELQTDNIPNDVKIPPLIFHTLIENGVTHSLKPKECGIFRIKYNKGNNLKEFIIQNNGSNLEKLKGQLSIFLEEGLGYKYIRSRLEEKYSNQWGLTYGINGAIWETKIKIYS